MNSVLWEYNDRCCTHIEWWRNRRIDDFKAILIHWSIEYERSHWLWKWRICESISWNILKRLFETNFNIFDHIDLEHKFATNWFFIINFEIIWKKQCDDVCDVWYIDESFFARSSSSCDVSKSALQFYHKQLNEVDQKKDRLFSKRFCFE